MSDYVDPYVTPDVDAYVTPAVQPGVGEDTPQPDEGSWVVTGVMALGVVIALPALLGLVGAAKLLSFGYISGAGTFGLLVDLVFLALGVGIVMCREQARVVYVVLAVVTLAFSVIGTVGYFTASSIAGASANTNTASAITETKRSIAGQQAFIASVQGNPRYATDIRSLQQNIAMENGEVVSWETTGTSHGKYTGLILGYLLAIFPLWFLTRPAVKEVFI